MADTPTILLTGAGGQLGTDIMLARPEVHGFTRDQLDITDPDAVIEAVEEVMPAVVIHAGAWTAVDLCEGDPDKAMAVNGEGTANVVAAAQLVGARVVFVSTDYVFDGTKLEPYLESDEPAPASVYGRSKLAGEKHVLAMGDRGMVVRTSWVCGAHGSNMVKTILRVAEAHPTLTFVDDQVGKPTFTADLAVTLLTLADGFVDDASLSGVFHVTNEGVVSWFEFCQEVLAAAGLDPARVQPCATHELDPPRPAPRPANSVLANTRFAPLGLPLLRDFRAPLEDTIAALQKAI